MDKKLRLHHDYIEKKIAGFGKKRPSEKELSTLLHYHENMIQNFQHERLIHLLVTLFFAMVMLAGMVSFMVLQWYMGDNGQAWLILAPAGLVCVILLVTTLFYIRHYYRLENGCEKLYDLTEELYRLV